MGTQCKTYVVIRDKVAAGKPASEAIQEYASELGATGTVYTVAQVRDWYERGLAGAQGNEPESQDSEQEPEQEQVEVTPNVRPVKDTPTFTIYGCVDAAYKALAKVRDKWLPDWQQTASKEQVAELFARVGKVEDVIADIVKPFHDKARREIEAIKQGAA